MKLSPANPTVGARLRPLLALAASTLLAVAPALQAGPPAPQAGTGTIKGKLIWGGGAIPKPKVAVKKDDPTVKDPICKAQEILNKDLVIDADTKGVANAFAYLVKPTGDFAAAEKDLVAKHPEVVIDQVNCEFVPYAAVVHKSQKLVFKSSDPVGHNVHFQGFANGAVNQMVLPNGKMEFPAKKGQTLKEERRPTELVCDIHPWMKGYFYVLEHPFATVTKTDGTFEITGVPAGTQQFAVWHSASGWVTANLGKGIAVTVKAGETTDVGTIKLTPK